MALVFCLLVLSAARSGPTECRACYGCKLFKTVMVFLKEVFTNDFEKNNNTHTKLTSMERVNRHIHLRFRYVNSRESLTVNNVVMLKPRRTCARLIGDLKSWPSRLTRTGRTRRDSRILLTNSRARSRHSRDKSRRL